MVVAVFALVLAARTLPNRGSWTLTVQLVLAATWTTYSLLLPRMMAQLGLDRRWVLPMLIADQAVFAIADWAAGVYVDRVIRTVRRLGRSITVGAAVSSVMLIAIPLAARNGTPSLFIATVMCWAVTSAVLRAPIFALLGRTNGASLRSGAVTGGLLGFSISGAFGPVLTRFLDHIEPVIPISVAAVALVIASVPAIRIGDGSAAPPVPSVLGGRRSAILCALAVLFGSFAAQVHIVVQAPTLGADLLGHQSFLWQPLFWAGFAVGLPVGSRLADRAARLTWAAGAVASGALLIGALGWAATEWSVVLLQPMVGMMWGIVLIIVIIDALSRNGGRGAGTAAGLVFSAQALATIGRLAIGRVFGDARNATTVAVSCAWGVTGAVLLSIEHRRRHVDDRRRTVEQARSGSSPGPSPASVETASAGSRRSSTSDPLHPSLPR